ncbi:MAG: Uncharacterised protein [Flavobacterium sp. SCGC AAA160-P02]|nr:MAG: Uncharacterised protein [Flavobacterium sp. SCGC AAA160-P02]
MIKKTTLLFFTLITTAVFSQTATVGGTSYSSLNDAYDAATGGQTIVIDGIFDEKLTSNKAVSLQGSNPATDGIIFTGTGRVLNYTSSVTGNFSISNLTIKGGDATGNGAGILVDKSSSAEIIMENLIIEENKTTANGGGLSINSANAKVTNCIVRNNEAKQGGGIHVAAVSGAAATAGADKLVTISKTLIHNNNAVVVNNAGGIAAGFYIYAAGSTTVNKKLTVNIENTTIALNNAEGKGGIGYALGGVLSTGGPALEINMTYVTAARNTAASSTTEEKNKFGLYFFRNAGSAAENPIFNAYNSIFVAAGVTANRSIHFGYTNPPNFINNVVGGQVNKANIVNDTNNLFGRTAGNAGVATALSDEGGFSNVLVLSSSGDAVDYCTSDTGTTLPNSDQRGYSRDANADAGAYELGGTPLSISEEELLSFSIYPNPTSQSINVKGIENIKSIKIYSILGSLQKEVSQSNQIDVSKLASGVYIVKIDNGNIYTRRVIIE